MAITLSYVLGEDVYAEGDLAVVDPEVELGQDLVAEGCAHDKGRVAGRTPQIHKPPLRKKNNPVAVRKRVAVNLRLDVQHRGRVLLQPGNINLAVKVA